MSTKADLSSQKSAFYQGIGKVFGSGLLRIERSQWPKRRSLLSGSFSQSAIKRLFPMMRTAGAELVHRLFPRAGGRIPIPVEMRAECLKSGFSIITQAALGKLAFRELKVQVVNSASTDTHYKITRTIQSNPHTLHYTIALLFCHVLASRLVVSLLL